MKFLKICFILVSILFFSCKDTGEIINEDAYRKNEALPWQAYTYSGDSLRQIAMPVGGIGTGNALIGGRGNILEWEIFGKADRDELPPYMTFFAMHIETPDGKKINRILEGQMRDDYPNPFGVPRQQLAGIPRFQKCTFITDFPFGRVILNDENIPLRAYLKTWNPFIPLESDFSSVPMANFDWNFENLTEDSLKTTIAFNFGNPFADYLDPGEDISGQVVSFEEESLKGVKFVLEYPFSAEFLVLADNRDAVISNQWLRGRWWDNAEVFWREFSKNGALEKRENEYKFTGEGLPDVSTISVPLNLGPNQSMDIFFRVFWRIPVRKAEPSMSLGTSMKTGKEYRNYYTVGYDDVEEIVDVYQSKKEILKNKTYTFHDLLYASSYPDYVIDALANNLASLQSNLIMRNENGKVHAFEGLGNDFGCCPGNCTHVWNYAQALAFLFPGLERDMRETNFLHDTHASGAMSFRTVFPPGPYHMMAVAADGQMGTIIRTYREWKLSGDTEWLRKLWPKISAALEFAWKGDENDPEMIPWDPEKEGLIRSKQHNTYDIDFYGPNMLTGSLYLGALKAAAEMASALGFDEKHEEYMSVYISGRSIYEDVLWNGDYYKQKVEVIEGLTLPDHYILFSDEKDETVPKYQFAGGCLSDQLLGQFLADVSGLGTLLDSSRIKTTLKSIHRYNFIKDFSDYENVQRVYALNEESGLILCSWPRDEKPSVPFVYSDEVWTGVEYQVASSLIYRGMVDEGLEIAKAVRDRYRGYNRNPFAEIESGRFYARSLSSWALLTSLSGYQYDGEQECLHFSPRHKKDNFYTFWSTDNAWGSFVISGEDINLEVFHGRLELKEFGFKYPEVTKISSISYEHAEIIKDKDCCILKFPFGLELNEGEKLHISMRN